MILLGLYYIGYLVTYILLKSIIKIVNIYRNVDIKGFLQI
nr:MAG TPA: hypothetical protein [Caudoviricetes sp.]